MTDRHPAPCGSGSELTPSAESQGNLRPVETVAVALLCSTATVVALECSVLMFGVGETKRLELWFLGFAVALPLGTFLGARQQRRLVAVPRAIARWALALGASLLMLGLVLLYALERLGQLGLLQTGSARSVVPGLLALAAYAVTGLASRRPAIFSWLEVRPAWAPVAVGVSAIVIMTVLFLPAPRPGRPFPSPARIGAGLIAVLVLAAVTLAAVLVLDRLTPAARRRRLFDVGVCVALAMVVFVVKLPMPADDFIHHHDFYLGPVNDMAHGRTMLVDVWAQYGVGLYYALLAAFSVLPLNHGGFVLLLSSLMAAQYVLVYVTLRIAIRSQALVVAVLVAAVMSNIFAPTSWYAVYPSAGPLRFGLPYLIVAAAVAVARWPRHAQALRVGQLFVIAVSAVWSIETFEYTAVTWFALTALLAFGRRGTGLRVFVQELVFAAVVSGGAVFALIVATRAASGAWPVWSNYFAYVFQYTVGHTNWWPLDFWSPALLVAAVIFVSAVGIVSLSRDDRVGVSQPVLVGLAGFTGIAWCTFPNFLVRPFPDTLLQLMPLPICAVGCLWASIFLRLRKGDHRTWPTVSLVLVLVVVASLTVYGMPGAVRKWPQTAFAEAVPFANGHPPGGGRQALRASIEDLWAGRTYDDEAVDRGATLLRRYDPGDGPALVLIPEKSGTGTGGIGRMWVTTEILLKARRANLLPISNPEQDNQIMSRTWPRIASAVDEVPDGTILLTAAFQIEPPSGPPILLRALQELRQRFYFQILESSPDGLQVVRLHPRR